MHGTLTTIVFLYCIIAMFFSGHFFSVPPIFYIFLFGSFVFAGDDNAYSAGKPLLYRLSDNVVPTHYDLTFIVKDANESPGFLGLAEIDVDVLKEPINEIVLNAQDITLLSTTVVCSASTKNTDNILSSSGDINGNKKNGGTLFFSSEFSRLDEIMSASEKSNLTEAVEYVPEKQLVKIMLNKEIEPLQSVKVIIKYKTKYNKVLEGVYKFRRLNKPDSVFITTHFEPTGARSAFPCFDEPTFKANFTVTLVHDADKIAISNMPVDKKSNLTGNNYCDKMNKIDDTRKVGCTVTRFATSIKMSTYLLAFSVFEGVGISETVQRTNFNTKASQKPEKPSYTSFFDEEIDKQNDFIEDDENSVNITVYGDADMKDQMQLALNVTKKVLLFFENFFGEPYPIPKLDLLAVPEFMSGAMENWGLITFRPIYLYYDREKTTSDVKKQVITVICHEIAHQWFGNLVTMKWWDDIWLNEGFANYVELIGADHYDPNLKILDKQITNGWNTAIELDSLNSTRSITSAIAAAVNIDEMFDTISYSKGAAMLRMIHHFMGNNFTEAIRSYIQKYKYANAETDYLWQVFNEHSDSLNIRAMMKSWIEQKSFPLLTVSVKYNKSEENAKSIVISQKSYLKAKASTVHTKRADLPGHQLESAWFIPISYVSSEEPKTSSKFILTPISDGSIRIKLKNDYSNELNRFFVKFNHNVTGFYLVNYDNELWESLIQNLKSKHTQFSELDRAGLIHDSFKLSCDGIISPLIPLKLIQYAKNELAYLPWSMLRSKYTCLFEVINYNKTENLLSRFYKLYIWNLQKHLVNLDILVSSSDSDELLQQYELALFTLKYNLDTTLKAKIKQLYSYLISKDLPKFKFPEIRTLALLYGVEGGPDENEDSLRKLWSLYKGSNDDYDRRYMMKAISTFSNDTEQSLYNLNQVLKDKIVKHQDMLTFITTIYKYCKEKSLCWDRIEHNWQSLSLNFQPNVLNEFIMNLVGFTHNSVTLLKIQLFMASHHYNGLNTAAAENSSSIVSKQIEEKISVKSDPIYNSWKSKSKCDVFKWFYYSQNYNNTLTLQKVNSVCELD